MSRAGTSDNFSDLKAALNEMGCLSSVSGESDQDKSTAAVAKDTTFWAELYRSQENNFVMVLGGKDVETQKIHAEVKTILPSDLGTKVFTAFELDPNSEVAVGRTEFSAFLARVGPNEQKRVIEALKERNQRRAGDVSDAEAAAAILTSFQE